MSTFLLTTVIVLFTAAPTLSARPRVGMVEGVRSLWNITQAAPNLQKLATTEIDMLAAHALHQLKITVPGFSANGHEPALPPLMQARVLLHEQEALLAALAKNGYGVKKELKKIIALTGEGRAVESNDDNGAERVSVIKFTHADGGNEHHEIDKDKLDSAVSFYINKALDLTSEDVFVVDTRENLIYLVGLARKLNETFGIEASDVRDRVMRREKAGRRDLYRALRELGERRHNNPFIAANTKELAERREFFVDIQAQAEPLVESQDWPTMSLPGVEVKAKIFELAARIAANYGHYDKLAANLQSIIDLSNSTDSVALKVTFNNMEVTLDEHTYHAVQQYYRKAFGDWYDYL